MRHQRKPPETEHSAADTELMTAGVRGSETGQQCPHLVIGVTGSIAAYKALEIIRRLREKDVRVSVVMTAAAQELIRPLSFETVAGSPVYTGMFGSSRTSGRIEHIDLAQSADLILIAPATANIIGKIASGIADDLLSTVVMATDAPVLIAPAMNERMWRNPIVQRNVSTLKGLGYRLVEPASGALACGRSGAGRLASVEEICQAVWELLDRRGAEQRNLLAGRRIIVTAGRTEEALDPVRVLTNRSSGRMGLAIAQAAGTWGAEVTLVAGRLQVPIPAGLKTVWVTTTEEMLAAVQQLLPTADALIMAAAPADYRPAAFSPRKLKASGLVLKLKRTPDILVELRQLRHHAVLVGFALESEQLLRNARAKLQQKGLDLIVANPVATIDAEEITAQLIFRDGRVATLSRMSKTEFARQLMAETARLIAQRQ